MMELILWRHADAADSVPDSERPLTEKGLKQAQRMAEFLRQRLPSDTRIMVSPAKRAQQTAQALGKYFHTEKSIAPNCSVQAILNAASWPDGEGTVLIVGHQPVLGMTAAQLLCDSNIGFSVKKGAIWWLTNRDEGEQATLRLVMAPDLV
jgi:phosphohistidine phosphatase